jgi:predicted transposase YdaD
MPYITSIERMGIEQGRVEGRVEGQRSLIDLLLNQKIGQLSQTLDDRISSLSNEKLNSLAIALLNFSTLGDLESWLQENR